MEWVVGVVCILVLLARRRSRKTMLENAKRKLDPLVLKGAAQSWMTAFYNRSFAAALIAEFRSQMGLPDILAYLHKVNFEAFDKSVSLAVQKTRRTHVWTGADKHGFYDSIAKEFFGDTFGSEVAETAMDRVENSSLSAPHYEPLTRRWAGVGAVRSILIEIQLKALTNSRANIEDLLVKQEAEEWMARLQPGYKAPEWTPGKLSHWDELVFCAKVHEYYLKNEIKSFLLSLRNAASDYDLPLEHWVEGLEPMWFEQSFYYALERHLGDEGLVEEFEEALEFVRQNP